MTEQEINLLVDEVLQQNMKKCTFFTQPVNVFDGKLLINLFLI